MQIIKRLIRKIKRLKYKSTLGSLGRGGLIKNTAVFNSPELIHLGNNVTINDYVVLNPYQEGRITVGNNVHISSGVIINATGLVFDPKVEHKEHVSAPVVIHDGCWIAAGAIINPGVTIGPNSLVGAGAVVTKDVPAGEVWAGVPAKFLKK